MATVSDLFIDQGTDWSAIIDFKNVNGTPRDFTNYTIAAQMRRGYGSTTYTSFTATIISPQTNGQIKLELSATTSSAMKAGRYVYDVEVTSASGKKSRLMEGIVTINPEVTR
jgi:hypothetical protein